MEKQVLAIIRKKNRRAGIFLTIALSLYFLIPLSLMFITDVVNRPSFFYGIPWAWQLAFLQIPLTWFFCGVYHAQAKSLEEKLEGMEKEGGP